MLDKCTAGLRHEIEAPEIHDTIECAGTILAKSVDTINVGFWGIRLYFAGWSTVVLIWSFTRFVIKGAVGNWFTYLINWSLVLDNIYLWMVVFLHLKIFNYVKELRRGGGVTRSRKQLTLSDVPHIDELGFPIMWNLCVILLNCGLSISIFTTIFYWAVTYQDEKIDDDSENVDFITWNIYGIIGGMIIIEFFLSTWQLSYYGSFYVVCLVVEWVILSVIFSYTNCHNEYDGGRYIHKTMDWIDEPGKAFGYSIALLVGIPFMHCLLTFIKNLIIREWVKHNNKDDQLSLLANDSLAQSNESDSDNDNDNEMNPILTKDDNDQRVQTMQLYGTNDQVSQKEKKIHDFGAATLGAGGLKQSVKKPDGESLNEWLAVNTVDFFNEICLLYGIITEYCTKDTCPNMSAGPKYEYLWADGVKYKKPIKVSAPEYVDLLITWVEEQINNPKIFPIDDTTAFPKNFKTIIKTVFKRLFRIYGHIYHSHIQKFVQLDAEAHLNSCFKHFYYFIEEFDLVDQHGLQPLQPLIDVIKKKEQYSQKMKYRPKFKNNFP